MAKPVRVVSEDLRMSADRVEMVLTVGNGEASAWMIGCDLSAEYVRINADYTT